MKFVQIDNKTVGDGFPTYVIAEVGINHGGSVNLAQEMVQAAWESGADAVKIQTFITNKFLHPSHPGYQYDIDAEIPHEEEQKIWDFARKRQINIFSTPEEFDSLEFIRRQNPSLIKIAAMDFNYQDLVQRASSLKKPIVLSAGMSTLEEVLQTVRWVEDVGNKDYILLHCVSCYPAPAHACNLRAIPAIKAVLDCPVGFSDHTIGIHIPLAAATLGANIIEKHFTIDKALPGPDQKCSMDPQDLRNLVNVLREIESGLGDGKKVPTPEEAAPRQFKRRGIYAARKLKRGHILREGDVVFFAPSSARSHVTDWPTFLGRSLARDIDEMTIVNRDDVL